MPASKIDTFPEHLNRILRSVQEAKVVMDADLPFLIQLETMLLDRIRQPETQMQQAGMVPPGAQNPQGNAALGLPIGAGMAGAPLPSQLGAGAPAGVMMAPPAPNNADELRRVLQAPSS